MKISIIFLIPLLIIICSCTKADTESSTQPSDLTSETGTTGEQGKSFWISPSGDDSNEGTSDQPFKTLSKAASALFELPPQENNIYLAPGIYKEAHPISIWDGTNIVGGSDKDEHSPEDVVIDFADCGDRMCNLNIVGGPDLRTTIEGISIKGKVEAIRSVDASPTISNCNISLYPVSSQIPSSAITILSKHGEMISPVIKDSKIISTDASGEITTDEEGREHVTGISYGVFVASTYEQNSAFSLTLENNEIMAGAGSSSSVGVLLSSNSALSNAVIRNNVISSGPSYNSTIGLGLGSRNYLSPLFKEVVIENNIITTGMGMEGSEYPSVTEAIYQMGECTNLKMVNNVIVANSAESSTGITLGGGGSADIFFNTILSSSSDRQYGLFVAPGYRSDVEDSVPPVIKVDLRNNIFCTTDSSQTAGIFVSTHDFNVGNISVLKNNLFCTDVNDFYRGAFDGTWKYISSISELNELRGNFSDNLYDTPFFVDKVGGDFHLESDSAGIDAALDIEGIDQDRDGNARPSGAAPDMGAYELQK